MRSYFLFNGQRSTDFGLNIEEYPAYTTAQRRVTEFEQPYSNGVWLYDTGRFGNASAEYAVYLKAQRRRLPEAAARVATWLQGPSGYQVLTDTYDPEHFRLARFAGPLDLSSWFHWYGRATLEFTCLPQRWLYSGQSPTTLTGVLDGSSNTPRVATILNPGMPSLPLVTLRRSGSSSGGWLQVGGRSIYVSIPASGITIDFEQMTGYAPGDPGTPLTDSVATWSEQLEIPSGASEIRWGDFAETIEITPRWWHL